MKMMSKVAGMAVLALAAAAASAAPLITPVGTPETASTITVTQYNQVSFTLGTGYQDVDIDASLVTPSINPSSGTAYLTNGVGAGATAANVIAQTSFNFARVGNGNTELGWVDLFSDLTLPAGTYYLVLGGPIAGPGGYISMSSSMTFDKAPGVSVGPMRFADSGSVNTAFPPASGWYTSGAGNRFFRVTGAVVPEPASLALLGMGGLLAARRRR